MIINTIISGKSNNFIDLVVNDSIFIVDEGDTVNLTFTYNHVNGSTGAYNLFSELGVIDSGSVDDGNEVTIDITSQLLTSKLYQFRLVATDRNGNSDFIEYNVVFDFTIEDYIISYDSEFNSYTIDKFIGTGNASKIPPFYNNGVNGLLAVTRIANGAFFDNDVIKNVTIPFTISEIGNLAFFSCINLSSVTLNVEVPPVLGGEEVFDPYGELSLLKIYVPSGLVSTYRSAQYWSEYSNDIVSQ
jgi:hypothetical protein